MIKDEGVSVGGFHEDYARMGGYANCYYSPMELEDPSSHHHGFRPPPTGHTPTMSAHHPMYSSETSFHPPYPSPTAYSQEISCHSPDCSPRFGGTDLAEHKSPGLFAVPEKRKCGSNKKERRRTQSINNAFANLRDCIPNVPCDTKLSKIKTLRLATSYIDYLMTLLNTNDPAMFIDGFKADIHKKWNEKSEEQKRKELEAELRNSGTAHRIRSSKRSGARTGWPQHVWALELN
eukprot:maker-scaffold96_size378025-snap-gene-2.46 protein:Tk04987 transcript:maker-scaffold96_size378025-snap-gene-2.46-mRNA-1 annotation:"unnamed protein product"